MQDFPAIFGFQKLDTTQYSMFTIGLLMGQLSWATISSYSVKHYSGVEVGFCVDMTKAHSQAHSQLTLREIIWNNPGGPDSAAERP